VKALSEGWRSENWVNQCDWTRDAYEAGAEAMLEAAHLHYMGVVEKAIDATLAAVRKNYRGVSWLYHQEKWQKMRDDLVSRFLEGES